MQCSQVQPSPQHPLPVAALSRWRSMIGGESEAFGRMGQGVILALGCVLLHRRSGSSGLRVNDVLFTQHVLPMILSHPPSIKDDACVA